jgi:hypothetical protein
MFLDHFTVLMSKIIFLKYKKYYFDTFLNKKYFKNNHNYTSKYNTKSRIIVLDNCMSPTKIIKNSLRLLKDYIVINFKICKIN